MDTHFLKIYEYYKSEYQLYEGLITSYPLHEVINILFRKKYNVKGNYNDNTFSLKFLFSEDISKSLIEYNKIMQITDTCGYFCSNMKGEDAKAQFIIEKYNTENFKKLINNGLTLINFSFEAKYDILIEKIPEFLYHLAPTRNISKILKFGLIPKSRSKKAFHPDRIYLVKNPEDLNLLFKSFYEETKINEWSILEIDTHILEYLKIYKDPNFKEKGYYTLNTINPIAIKIYSEFNIN
jgi:hypothetical protein